MLEITNKSKNYGCKTVSVTGATGVSDRTIVTLAFNVCNETLGDFENPARNVGGFGSSFGYQIKRDGDHAIVIIHTD